MQFRLTLILALALAALAVPAGAQAAPLFGYATQDVANFKKAQTLMPIQLWSPYVAWGDGRGMAYWMQQARALHVRPYVTWEPWTGGFSASGGRAKQFTTADIAAGKQDRYIKASALAIKRYHQRVYLRLGHEMNGWWYPWSVGKGAAHNYKKMWIHTVKLFRKYKVRNARFIWAPNPVAGGTSDIENLSMLKRWWPGSKYVDEVGMTVTRGLFHGGIWVPDFMHRLELIRAFSGNKPTWIAESTVDKEELTQWLPNLRQAIDARPWLKGIVWLDSVKQDPAKWGTTDWKLVDTPFAIRFLTWRPNYNPATAP